MKGIHNWLSEPATNISFIEQAFGESSVKKAECDRKKDPFCSNCGFKYKMHRSYFGSGISTANYMYCPDRLRSQQVYKHCSALEVKHFFTESKINQLFTLSDTNQRTRLLKLIEFISYE